MGLSINRSMRRKRLTMISHTFIFPSPPVLASHPLLPSPSSKDFHSLFPFAQLIEYILRSWPLRTAACSHLHFSALRQIRMVRSSEADARNSPHGENARDQTVESWPSNVWKSYQSSEGSSTYNRIVLSYDPDARI